MRVPKNQKAGCVDKGGQEILMNWLRSLWKLGRYKIWSRKPASQRLRKDLQSAQGRLWKGRRSQCWRSNLEPWDLTPLTLLTTCRRKNCEKMCFICPSYVTFDFAVFLSFSGNLKFYYSKNNSSFYISHMNIRSHAISTCFT